MTILTSQEIARYRSELAECPGALAALDTIEDCEGDLEDAAISLGIQVGQQPDRGDWLDGLAKRCRVAICQEEFQESLVRGELAPVVNHLVAQKICPAILATPVAIYAIEQGIEQFCEPLSFKQL
ncbi:hypothetical protein IQ235_00170 [Oscillatoriales cyanobacterium LEGE 11467]|uniref:Uncharacterized protein n=1 Tax=Zarconia navalis LEGE 11467 TaxID=1828826 RepID=A0A928VX00_9CYAN|nr:hypothetical protein [Zarconia navalis]MBE9039210.1 hypothetical protein [Zarconia navalis LEGE 11467]